MSSKKLQTEGIANELEGASLYFHPLAKNSPDNPNTQSPTPPPTPLSQPVAFKKPNRNDKLQNHASTLASKIARKITSKQASRIASMTASMKANKQASRQDSKIASTLASMNKSGRVHEIVRSGHKEDLIKTGGGEPSGTQKSMYARKQDDFIETIRKSVKKVGREALFIRLTLEEKNKVRLAVDQINEFYRGTGSETTDTEVGRIALNYLLEDYKTNGEQSILAITLEALNA